MEKEQTEQGVVSAATQMESKRTVRVITIPDSQLRGGSTQEAETKGKNSVAETIVVAAGAVIKGVKSKSGVSGVDALEENEAPGVRPKETEQGVSLLRTPEEVARYGSCTQSDDKEWTVVIWRAPT